MFFVPLDAIQPSQFYISATKPAQIRSWITDLKQPCIPVMESKIGYVALDGHARMKACKLSGVKKILCTIDEIDDNFRSTTLDFVKEA